MLLERPSNTPVFLLRATVSTSSYGYPVENWAFPTRERIPYAQVQGRKSVEVEGENLHLTVDNRILFIRGNYDITSADRIEYEDEIWRIDGNPVPRDGLACAVYTTAALVRVTT